MTKQKTRPRMDYGIDKENHLPYVKKKQQARNRIFDQAPLSHSA